MFVLKRITQNLRQEATQHLQNTCQRHVSVNAGHGICPAKQQGTRGSGSEIGSAEESAVSLVCIAASSEQ